MCAEMEMMIEIRLITLIFQNGQNALKFAVKKHILTDERFQFFRIKMSKWIAIAALLIELLAED